MVLLRRRKLTVYSTPYNTTMKCSAFCTCPVDFCMDLSARIREGETLKGDPFFSASYLSTVAPVSVTLKEILFSRLVGYRHTIIQSYIYLGRWVRSFNLISISLESHYWMFEFNLLFSPYYTGLPRSAIPNNSRAQYITVCYASAKN